MTPAALGLAAHPEGGWYRETWRSPGTVVTPYGERSPATAILFLVQPGQWQAARPSGDEAVLVACVVSPGFDFADFRAGGPLIRALRKEFLDQWGQRGTARGAVVVVLSDGWERGDATLLGEQMARLHRLAHRVVWSNPRKAAPGYAPVAAGMAAALPHVDDFVEGHSLGALEHLAAVVRGA